MGTLDTTKVVKLLNGSEELDIAVAAIMLNLTELLSTRPIILYELWQKCLNPEHEIWGAVARQTLISMGMMTPAGDIHKTIRNVVVSACVAIEGKADFSFRDPRVSFSENKLPQSPIGEEGN